MGRTYVIAEAGSSHDGSLDMALELVQIAKDAGADACKFQYWSNSLRMAERRHTTPEAYKTLFQCEWHGPLAEKCAQVGLDYMCTVYLPEDIVEVAQYVAKFKVASFEALDTNFILDHLEYRKPIIVSTGMMDARETHRLLGLRDLIPEIQVLHCVSAYPAPLESLNLSVIREMGLDGFSDHSKDEGVGACAILMGARIIEVHYRHPGTDVNNPDTPHSFTPTGLTRYINAIRDAEKLMGTGLKAPQEAEKDMVKYRVVR